MELVAPAELITGLAQCVVTDLCTRMSLGQVGSVCGNLIRDDPCAYVFAVGQTQVFFRSHVTQHRSSQPSDLCGSDSRSNVVISRSNVGYQRAQRIERCVVTVLDLTLHILLNLMQGHVSRSFDESLHVLVPCTQYEFSQGIQFRKLRFVVRICDTARTETVSQGYRYVILGQDIADFIKMLVQERLAVVYHAPFAHDTSSP